MSSSYASSERTLKVVKNPYAQRKAPPEISTKPLHDFDDNVSEVTKADVVPTEHLQSVEQPRAQLAVDEHAGDIGSERGKETSKPQPSESSTSVDLPQWQRLASQNISIGSAEILTVSECAQHSTMYMGRSVRVIGLVVHRHVRDASHILLVLRDPLVPMTVRGKGEPSRARMGCRPNGSAGASDFVAGGLQKRPRSPPRDESFVFQADACFCVTADPNHVSLDHSTVSDLVMVMGEVQSSNGLAFPNHARPIQHVVAARICQNANGTNMKLYNDALLSRRKLLQRGLVRQDHPRQGCGPIILNTSNTNC